MEYATDTMNVLGLDDSVQEEVKHYLTYTQIKQDYQEDYEKFMTMLSPSLKQKVVNNINNISILKNPIFKDQTDLIESILDRLRTRPFLPEDKIIKQGDIGTWMYFLSRGEWSVFVTDENKISKNIKTLEPGDYFGEVSAIKRCKRTASVISKNYTTLAELLNSEFDNICDKYPFIRQAMIK